MKNNHKGFTLIELAVVLAIIAVLAAVLRPLVTSYIDEARNTRAASDMRAIAQAYRLHFRDTSKYPVFTDNSTTTIIAEVIKSAGTDPTDGVGLWSIGTGADIDTYLNTNQLGLDTSGNFRGGRTAYRGPYLESVGSDPWGNAFLVTATSFGDANVGFVLSAGPNGTIDTTYAQTDPTASEDDILFRIE